MTVRCDFLFDSLSVGRYTADFTKSPSVIEAKAAFVNSRSGMTHGWTSGIGPWSERTLQLAQELQEALARDIAQLHARKGSVEAPAAQKPGLRVTPPQDTEGIGEHVDGDKTPSV